MPDIDAPISVNQRVQIHGREDVGVGEVLRICVDTLLYKRRGSDKCCVDITTGLIHQPQGCYTIAPENRLFIIIHAY